MDYNYVQFISYEANTFPKTVGKAFILKKLVDLGPPQGVVELPFYSAENVYLGSKVSQQADINARCKLMKQAIDTAVNRPKISASSKCLKVFMAPEFYFRGTTGAYSLEGYQEVISKLRQMVQDQKFEHWLFIFGSILATFDPAASETQGSTADRCANPPKIGSIVKKGQQGHMAGKKAALNVSLVQKGNAGEELSSVVIKEIMSPIDFMEKKGVKGKSTGTDPGIDEAMRERSLSSKDDGTLLNLEEELVKLCNFFEPKDIKNFLDNLEEHKRHSYKRLLHGPVSANKLLYHSSSISFKCQRKLDQHLLRYHAELTIKYLETHNFFNYEQAKFYCNFRRLLLNYSKRHAAGNRNYFISWKS